MLRSLLLAMLIISPTAFAQPTTAPARPLPVPSEFSDDHIAIDFAPSESRAFPIAGVIGIGGNRADRKFLLEARMQGSLLTGSFKDEAGQVFPFTAEFDGAGANRMRWSIRFHTGRTTYTLYRREGIIGIAQPQRITGGHRITEVLRDTPASQAGLRPDDVIISVDGRPCTGREDRDSLGLIGEVGAPVQIEVRHADGSTAHYTLTRILNENPPSVQSTQDDGNDRDR